MKKKIKTRKLKKTLEHFLDRNRKKLKALLKRHKKIKLVLKYKTNLLYGERILDNRGNAMLRYHYFDANERSKYGRYDRSCFIDDHYEWDSNKRIIGKCVTKTLKFMLEHDYGYLDVDTIYAGKDFKKQINVKVR